MWIDDQTDDWTNQRSVARTPHAVNPGVTASGDCYHAALVCTLDRTPT